MTPDPKKVNFSSWESNPLATEKDEYNSLSRIFYHYSLKGRIDRNRLIDEILGALWNDFPKDSLTGLNRFYKILAPSVEEIHIRQSKYFDLFRNPYPPTVTMALTEIEKLVKNSTVDYQGLLDAIPSVFEIQNKSQPQKAIKLIDKITSNNSDLIPDNVDIFRSALIHPNVDIQNMAVQFITKWKSKKPDLILSSLEEVMDSMSAIVRKEIINLLPSVETLPETELQDSSSGSLVDRINELPIEFQKEYGLDQAEECFANCRLPNPLFLNPQTTSVLSTLEKMISISSIDELLEKISLFLEDYTPFEQAEKIIEGIFQYGNDTCENFDIRIKQLYDRKGPKNDGFIFSSNQGYFINYWINLKCGITDFKPLGSMKRTSELDELLVDYRARDKKSLEILGENLADDLLILDLKNRFDKKQMGPILSTPTHQGGWIDPRQFIQRYIILDRSEIPVSPYDLILALLRLAPDFRDKALEEAKQIQDKYGPAIRYALGGSDLPVKTDDEFLQAVWVAAGRSLNPFGTLHELAPLGLNKNVPNMITPAKYKIEINAESQTQKIIYWNYSIVEKDFVILNEPTEACSDQSLYPTVASTRLTPIGEYRQFIIDNNMSPRRHDLFPRKNNESIQSFWPGYSESCFAYCINGLFHKIDRSLEIDRYEVDFWDTLMIPDKKWTDLGCIAIWLGLLGADKEVNNLCTDILLQGILDGRANLIQLRETFFLILQNPIFDTKRLLKPFLIISEISALTKWFIFDIQDAIIASWEQVPRNSHKLLEPQLELQIELELSISSDSRKILEGVKGSGKGAKLAKQLCAFEEKSGTAFQLSAIEQAFEERLSRAIRIRNHLQH